jgi:ubiquitin-protein ligase
MHDPSLRRERLRRGYEELLGLRGNVIDFDAYSPPIPERYLFRFKLRSILDVRNGRPVYSEPHYVHSVTFTASPAYPSVTRDDIQFTSHPIFHPNVFTSGQICTAGHRVSESLGEFILRIARMIVFDRSVTGLTSPANGTAATWYSANLALFPTDRRPLPSLDPFQLGPAQEEFSLGPRKR